MGLNTVVLAGVTGDLGGRIGLQLMHKGGLVRAIIRPTTSNEIRRTLQAQGFECVESSYDLASLTALCRGADCVVSAINGLEDTIITQQGALLDAAVAAGVPRFIPSDFSLDYTRTQPGQNRNMDLRRLFRARLNAAPIQATSILNGAFSTVLTQDAPILLPKWNRVLHWGHKSQMLNFTTKDDVADFTADAALDRNSPRDLRIAGGSASPQEIARIASQLSGKKYRTIRAGSINTLSWAISLIKTVAPSPHDIFPAWQGMQYLRDMMSGRGLLTPLDNERYGKKDWTNIETMLATILIT